MKSFVSKLILMVNLVVLANANFAQSTVSGKASEKRREYLSLVEKLKKGDGDVNFGQVRKAFVEWKISGGQDEPHPKRAEMVKAFQSNNHAEAVKLASEVLDYEFYNHNVFGAVADAYKALNDKAKTAYYEKLFLQAQHGLFLSGNGKSPETAYYVLTVSEEYRVMRELGFTATMQSLEIINGRAYDVLSGKDEKGKDVSIYFNICFFYTCGTN